MRIRKRQVRFPLSSLSSVPVSDPHCFGRSPAVQLQLHNQPTTQSDAPPSDQPNQPTGGGNNGPDFPETASGAQEKKNNDCMKLLLKEDERGGGEEDRSHDFRKGSSSSGAYMDTADLAQSYSSGEAVGSWCEGEKAFPLKKRRGSFDRPSTNEQETTMEKNKKMKTKMKTKMNKKPCVKPAENGEEEEEEEENDREEKKIKEGLKKRGTRGTGELMEGSRCSRVNGRGWRCCQKTLVGYSLCEHHLGKGRLRSMNSVRNRSLAASAASPLPLPKNAVTAAPLSIPIPSSEKEEQQDEKKPLLMARKKRVKLGMVKARSISSLLGENSIAGTSTLANGDQTDLVKNQAPGSSTLEGVFIALLLFGWALDFSFQGY